jgi:cation diffusion facilitator CzcD-associated flavoprotein CzcO
MPSPSLRLAVVGAGAAGLVAARELRREGHSPVVFERAASVGGTWLYDAAPATSDPLAAGAAHSSLYASLRTNLPREVMGFLDFPFASSAAEAGGGGDTRRFPGHDEVLRYLEEFARRFDLYGLVRFGTEVVRVRRDGGGGGGRWAVTSRKIGEKGRREEEEEVYDAIVVCNGHYTEPRVAHIPGNLLVTSKVAIYSILLELLLIMDRFKELNNLVLRTVANVWLQCCDRRIQEG